MSEVRTLNKIIEYCEDKLKSSSGEVKECLKEIKDIYYLKNYYDPQLIDYNLDWEDYEFTKEEVERRVLPYNSKEKLSDELYENMMKTLDETKRHILEDELESIYHTEKDELE